MSTSYKVKCDKKASGHDSADDSCSDECTVWHRVLVTSVVSDRPNDIYVPFASTLEGMRNAERV